MPGHFPFMAFWLPAQAAAPMGRKTKMTPRWVGTRSRAHRCAPTVTDASVTEKWNMGNKLLIDAAHPEETRVVVCHGNKVEEFDFEAATKRQLRGNIYLAKVTRVEPSLQAAFVDYGGNRHGFLAFNEIHPDYYQIPVSDREALIAEQAAEASRAAEFDELDDPPSIDESDDGVILIQDTEFPDEGDQDEIESDDQNQDGQSQIDGDDDQASALTGTDTEVSDEDADGAANIAPVGSEEASDATGALGVDAQSDASPDSSVATAETATEDLGQRAANDEKPKRERRGRGRRRSYKIQEVIKRRQILLVQVVKEERGNKGAALTTYLSLAGRYCVLMPNTARGGGISRKITNARDRKRLKAIATDLEIPEGMGLIIRTAGANRTKAEIKRDFEYLLRLWENVRDLTLESTAPCLVYEEGSLIKRSIRDLYSKEIDSVLVDGEEGYKEAKAFMRMLMPSHAKNVQPYKDPLPLFQKFQIEAQLDSMFRPTVQLKSGGYLVINPTEALVSVDVNSGRATKEHNIEDTALKTNLEAAEEISRQLRLRDLAGLVVIDFIDMEDNRNNRAVEKRMKECLKNDRARIQVGRISMFGLMEMSRQRIRAGILEGSTVTCPHCEGVGIVRSIESTALHTLRAIEDECLKKPTEVITLYVPLNIANYIMNQKRSNLLAIEKRYGVSCVVLGDESLNAADFRIEKTGDPVTPTTRVSEVVTAEVEQETSVDDEEKGKRRKRRRKRKPRRTDDGVETAAESDAETDEQSNEAADATSLGETTDAEARADDDEEKPKRRRRRGRRGGRRNRPRTEDAEVSLNGETNSAAGEPAASDTPQDQIDHSSGDSQATPERSQFSEMSAAERDADNADTPSYPGANQNAPSEATPQLQSSNGDAGDNGAANQTPPPSFQEPESTEEILSASLSDAVEEDIAPPEIVQAQKEEPAKPRRRGWWQKR
jgi:ribonuclease E